MSLFVIPIMRDDLSWETGCAALKEEEAVSQSRCYCI